MRKASSRQLQHNQDAQAAVMNDLCNIIHVSFSSGTYGTHSTQTRVMISGVACGIGFPQDIVRNLKQGNVATSPQLLIMDYDAILRLPASQSLLVTDEVQLIEKGEFVISGTFRPSNPPTVNSSVQHVQLKRVVP